MAQEDHATPKLARRLRPAEFVPWVKSLLARGHAVFVVYEACGFGLCWQLTALGATCYVIAPQKLDEQRKGVKTDALGVWTGDEGNKCSERWVTLFGARLTVMVGAVFVEGEVVILGFGRGVVEVDPAERLVAEEDFVEAVGGGRAQGDRLGTEALAEEVGAVAPGDGAFGFDRAYLVAGSVFDRRQARRPRTVG